MYKVWYWALIDRQADNTFIAHSPDLPDVTAAGTSEKDAITNLTALVASYIQQLVEDGRGPPRPSQASEITSTIRAKELSRALVPVNVPRAVARPSAKYSVAK
jgi:predicted RNase H-like HicB family nuclease